MKNLIEDLKRLWFIIVTGVLLVAFIVILKMS